jgi:hypothetical protein
MCKEGFIHDPTTVDAVLRIMKRGINAHHQPKHTLTFHQDISLYQNEAYKDILHLSF